MEVPKTFKPKKDLEGKIREMASLNMKILTPDKIGSYHLKERNNNYFYWYTYIKSAIESTWNIYQDPSTENYMELRVLKFEGPAKIYLQELTDEIYKGLCKNFIKDMVFCLIKQEFAIIIVSDGNGDLKLFRRYYQDNFGFY